MKSIPKYPLQPQVLAPNPSARAKTSPPLTSFALMPAGPGKLLLKYQASRPDWELDPGAPLVIQLNATPPLTLNPSVITRTNWPKGATQMPITYAGASPGKDNPILGKAAYTVCERSTRECRKAQSPVELHLKR